MNRIIAQRLVAWLAGLDRREKLLLQVCVITVVAAGLYVGVWQPLLATREREEARIARYERLSATLSQQPSAVRDAPDPRPMPTILTQTAAEQGLGLQRLDTPKPDTVSVTMQDASFETLVLWIDGLNRDAGLVITSATIRRTETPGIVSAELSLDRAAQ